MSYRQKHPDWSAQRIIDKIRHDFFILWKQKNPRLSDDEINAKIKLPGKDSVLGYFRENKPNEEKQSCLEQRWHIGAIVKKPHFYTPPEALPFILMAKDWSEKNPDEFGSPHEPFTIRQALWVSRLYGMVSLDAVKKKKDAKIVRAVARYLYLWSEAYASRERVCELSNTSFNTAHLDKLIQTRGIPMTSGKSTIVLYPESRSFEIDTIDDELLNQMEAIKKDGE